jgi:uncharacterized membrane protein
VDPAQPSAASRAVAEQTITVPANSEKIVFRFQLRPEKTGVLFYRLRVASKRDWENPADASTEATLANNEAVVSVDRGSERHRVLYVSGRPNWEHKFLQRAIVEDLQTQLVSLIRIARREAKFEFRGRAGESSNPLFRGFGNQSAEEVERYDQPVLIRLGVEDEVELSGGFPKTPEELYRYRAVILDDLEAEFFTREQMNLLQRFVSERGGGFLMLGGAESYAEGKFSRTPIGEMLPVYLDKSGTTPAGMQLQLSFTREGLLQPWARLRPSESDERQRLGAVPHFDVLNQVREAKPAAMVVATVGDGSKTYPALVTQRFGRGRTASLLIGDLWQAGLGDPARQKDLGQSWRQMMRWLTADVPERIEVLTEPEPGTESVRIAVHARDEKFQPLDNARVELKVHPLGAPEPVVLTAEASATEPGFYEALYVPRESGGYRVAASVTNESGGAAGNAQTGWTTNLAAAEFQSLVPNRALMEALAKKTGGHMVTAGQLGDFVRTLTAKPAPVTESWTQPLWHTPAVFLFALTCFVSEWGLRRWKGLA